MNTSARTIFLSLALLVAGCSTWSVDYQTGHAAYQSGDFATALQKWVPLAEQGQVDAQYNLGFMYFNGQGVPQDNETAIKWYTLSAEQGNVDAQYSLGGMYAHGIGVPQDYKTALKWFTLSAEQGNAPTQLQLGWMYVEGKGVPKDSVYAYMWLNIAASNGNEDGGKLRDELAKHMTPADISAAKDLARECVRKEYKGC